MKNSIQEISNQCTRQLGRLFYLNNEDKEDLSQEIWIHLFQKFGENSSESLGKIYLSGLRKGLNLLRDLFRTRNKECPLNDHDLIDEYFERDLIQRIGTEQELDPLPYHLHKLGLMCERGIGLEDLCKTWEVSTRTMMRWKKELRSYLKFENKNQTITEKSQYEQENKKSQHCGISCNSRRKSERSHSYPSSARHLISLSN